MVSLPSVMVSKAPSSPEAPEVSESSEAEHPARASAVTSDAPRASLRNDTEVDTQKLLRLRRKIGTDAPKDTLIYDPSLAKYRGRSLPLPLGEEFAGWFA